MKKLLLYIYFSVYVMSVYGQKGTDNQSPKLVVGIVVDQMRWDYLYKYYDRYTEDGFKRLLNEGYSCQNTMIDYVPTFTGPGHASIYTGTVPAIHGIASNDWVERSTGAFRYCVDDETVSTVGGSTKPGKMSPANMLTTTITDELHIATRQRAKVFGVGLKDRGSILPAGHSADGAFWFDDSTGNFITSTYYMNSLPAWMDKFNDMRWADTIMNTVWTTLYPINTYANSTADNTDYEGEMPGEDSPVFPHKTPAIKGRGYYGIRFVPGGNSITLGAAMSCIEGEQMGRDKVTDFLCVTLSTTDYAGHVYGPDAVELEDMYLRLDRQLGAFFTYLDEEVGAGEYTVFLTADHGAAHNASYMHDLKIPAGSETQVSAADRLNAYLKEQTGKDSLVLSLYNYQVYLNEQLLTTIDIDRSDLKEQIAGWLEQQEGVAYVADLEEFDEVLLPNKVKEMVVNGYFKDRCGSMQVVMKPGWYSGHGKTGTTHGSWNPYDAHIPLLWYGWGINQGETYRTVHITDIAPTLAALLHIQMPNGCIGDVIPEVIK